MRYTVGVFSSSKLFRDSFSVAFDSIKFQQIRIECKWFIFKRRIAPINHPNNYLHIFLRRCQLKPSFGQISIVLQVFNWRKTAATKETDALKRTLEEWSQNSRFRWTRQNLQDLITPNKDRNKIIHLFRFQKRHDANSITADVDPKMVDGKC